MRRLVSSCVILMACGSAAGSDVLVATKTQEKELLGRTTLRYEHDCLPEWGQLLVKRQYFHVMLPKTKNAASAPLIVYLHSAGGNAESESKIGGDFVTRAGPEFMGLMPNSPVGDVDGWWGANAIRGNKESFDPKLTPTEQRVLATIEWVARNHNVDRNRIYLCGISMGGSGALGLGMRHGDMFAAIWTGVPAGALHALHRMRLPEPPAATASAADREAYLRAVSGHGLPDAPPVLNFSSHTDSWAKDQPRLLRAVHDGRHPMVFAWGPWGHSNSYHLTHRAAYEFPWLAIRKNEAYPAFTNASTDQRYPGANASKSEPDGQINAFFRWKAITDAPEEFAMDLRLVDKAELSKPADLPQRSTVDVTPRRLQKFKVKAGKNYAWTFGSRSGIVRADAADLLTVERLEIGDKSSRLTVKAMNPE